MRVAMFSWESLHSCAHGGVAAHVTELAAALERRGHELHVFTRPGYGVGGIKRIDGVWYHYCPHNLNRSLVDEARDMCRSLTWHFLRSEDFSGHYDVIHAHDWLACDALTWIKAARPNHRAVLTMHSTEYGRCGNQFCNGSSARIRDHERSGSDRADRVIAVSGALRKELMWMYNLPESKCCVIHNGVQVHQFNGFIDVGAVKQRYALGPMDPMILFSGRLCLQKGPDFLVDAIPGLLGRHSRCKFVFAGDGHMRPELERRAQRLGVTHAVRFLGHRNGGELPDLYRACDALCMPSRNEPFGISVLEAWAAGKPVVATEAGGPGEFVSHGVDGLKIRPATEWVSWGIDSIFMDFEWARWMGSNGRRRAETCFTWDGVAEQTERCYHS